MATLYEPDVIAEGLPPLCKNVHGECNEEDGCTCREDES